MRCPRKTHLEDDARPIISREIRRERGCLVPGSSASLGLEGEEGLVCVARQLC